MKSALKDKTFENVQSQIGFCGIWCGSCVVGNGTLRELTKRYEKIIRAYGLEKWAPKDFDYKEFFRALASIQGMPSLCPGCLKGGGRENCEMRTCASNKNIDDCNSCYEFSTCKHAKTLQIMRSGSLSAGLFVKTENVDSKELVKKWTAELKNKWPCCILFMNDQ